MSERAMPGTVPRNGMPEFRPYVYGGTGEDAMPTAITRTATPKRAYIRRQPVRCHLCRYIIGSPGHKIMCGEP